MNTRAIVALALLTGCNYDYSIIDVVEQTPSYTDVDDTGPYLVAYPDAGSVESPVFSESTPPTDDPDIVDDTGTTQPEDTDAEYIPLDTDTDAPPPVDTDIPVDTDVVPLDTGSVVVDADTDPPLDTGVVIDTVVDVPLDTDPPVDTAVPVDTGSPVVDTGTVTVDTDTGTVPPVDTGFPPPPPPPPPPPVCDFGLPQNWELVRFDGGAKEGLRSYISDVDHDGFLDVSWVNQLDNNMKVLWGLPGGPDPMISTGWTTYSVGRSEGYVSWGDFDKDGRDDMVVSNQDAGRVRIFGGSGPRSYYALPYLSISGFPQRVILHDGNGDGNLDLLVGLGSPDKTMLWPGNGAGTWGAPVDFIPSSRFLRAVDLDGDRRNELLQSPGGAIYTSTGTPYVVSTLPLKEGDGSLGSSWPVDLDDDGDMDVVAHNGSRLLAWKNTAGMLERCGESGLLPEGYNPSAIGDIDGDGYLDSSSQSTCSFCGSIYFLLYGTP